ncbi:M42 family metallopeptidase [Haloplasma contractile]|uniref:Aminopeptidase YsdC protein n=1 Tax=Haloplasma contractile SSD-17B TaxID=1033810 RepID=U2EF05_9MOLU|nr:M42 family metallopeptidase [Haloplasma contractile]ERJ13508.1 Putative aminopeptidase YsdC protein [Haloplasma contractile SSD-17B]
MANYDETLTMLKELTDANAVPGNERQAKEVMKKYISPLADEVTYDHLGSIIAKKVGDENGPKIMIAGHLDEVGFMVTKITDKGFIKFQTLGGWWSQVMLAQQVTITTRKGEEIHGVIGSKPPHILSAEERKKPVDIKNMFIDIGIDSKEEVEKIGIRPGDMITPYIEFRTMANDKYLLAKAWDNRIGCAIAIDVLNKLKDENHPNVVFGVGTVQEEVGLRGAKTSAAKINPDIGIGLDVGIAGDMPGVSDIDSEFGKGPQIMLYDRTMVGHKGLRDLVFDICEEHDLPYQVEALQGGGLDTGAIHLNQAGAPSIGITIPSRYIHSHTSMIHRDDYENAVKIIVEVIKQLDRETVDRLTFE